MQTQTQTSSILLNLQSNSIQSFHVKTHGIIYQKQPRIYTATSTMKSTKRYTHWPTKPLHKNHLQKIDIMSPNTPLNVRFQHHYLQFLQQYLNATFPTYFLTFLSKCYASLYKLPIPPNCIHCLSYSCALKQYRRTKFDSSDKSRSFILISAKTLLPSGPRCHLHPGL